VDDFNYHEPKTLADAAAALRAARDGVYIAGGMSLIPALKHRRLRPSDLIDLRLIDGLSGIRRDGESLVVGAMTKHADVANSDIVRNSIPDLARLVGEMADPSVRNRATLGGSIAHADPASDYPPALVALDATILTGDRTISADAFFTGPFTTALHKGEIIRAVSFPIPDNAAYVKFPNTASRYAIVGVFAARRAGTVRLAVTGAKSCVFRIAEMEAALATSFTPEAIKSIVVDPRGLTADIHGTPEYRAHLVGVMAQRALASAIVKSRPG
jgi:aerobic carbon-monoxide dehydrogenase medium subunit